MFYYISIFSIIIFNLTHLPTYQPKNLTSYVNAPLDGPNLNKLLRPQNLDSLEEFVDPKFGPFLRNSEVLEGLRSRKEKISTTP